MAEQWRAVPDWEGLYEVSDEGRVRSLPRTDSLGRTKGGKVLAPIRRSTRTPYMAVWLTDGPRRSMVNIHILVMLAFAGARPAGSVVRHANGDGTDNRRSNLTWGSQAENVADEVAHGTHRETRKTHCPRLHELREPNLRPAQLAVGKRACLACSRARAHALNNGIEMAQEVADRYYAQIMGEVAA